MVDKSKTTDSIREKLNHSQNERSDIPIKSHMTDRELRHVFRKESIPQSDKMEAEAKSYEEELKELKAVPNKIKDMLNLSLKARNIYTNTTRKIKIIDFILCVCSITTIVLVFLDCYQIVETYNILLGTYVLSLYNNVLRFITIAFNFIICGLILYRYKLLLEIHKIRSGPVADFDNFYSVGYLKYITCELIINLLCIPPYIDGSIDIEGSIWVDYYFTKLFNTQFTTFPSGQTNDILKAKGIPITLTYNIASIIAFFIMGRVYQLFRLLLTFSYWETPRAQTVNNWMNSQSGLGFTIKSLLKVNPFSCLIVGVTFVTFFFGLATQLFEYYNSPMIKSLCSQSDCLNHGMSSVMQAFESVYNSLWLMLVTMTTVGYGDIYPTTYFGRVIAIAACISGTFILSLLVVFLSNIITLDDLERKVYNQIEEQHASCDTLKKLASKFVGIFLHYSYLSKENKPSTGLKRFQLFIEMKYHANKLKKIRGANGMATMEIGDVLSSLETKLEHGIEPLKKQLEKFNHDKIFNLKRSNEIAKKMKCTSMQTLNLLKVINKKKYLKKLKSINDVYDHQTDMIEEIEYYHIHKLKFDAQAELLREKCEK